MFTSEDHYLPAAQAARSCTSSAVKIGTGIGTIPALFLTDSIAIGRWPVRGCAWADRKDTGSWVEEERDREVKESRTEGV